MREEQLQEFRDRLRLLIERDSMDNAWMAELPRRDRVSFIVGYANAVRDVAHILSSVLGEPQP